MNNKDIGKILGVSLGVVAVSLVLYFLIQLSSFTLTFLLLLLSFAIVEVVMSKTITKRTFSTASLMIAAIAAFVDAIVLAWLNISLVTFNWYSVGVFAVVTIVIVFALQLLRKIR